MVDQGISLKVAGRTNENSNDITQTKPLWTVKDVAHYLKLQPETIREMARNEELPAIKLGRIWRFSKEKIEKWIVDKMEKNEPSEKKDSHKQDDL